MSDTRGGYPDTYVESVEWQRDKAYARAEKAEREREVHFEAAGALRTRLRECMDARDAAEARAEGNNALLAAEIERARTAEVRAEKAEREALINRVAVSDIAARAEKLASALENIADKDFDCQDAGCGLPVPVCRDIAARALAENNNNEGGKK